MLIEILDDQHIQGSAQYIESIKNDILKINNDELKKYKIIRKKGYRLN